MARRVVECVPFRTMRAAAPEGRRQTGSSGFSGRVGGASSRLNQVATVVEVLPDRPICGEGGMGWGSELLL